MTEPVRRGFVPGFVVGLTAGFASLEIPPLGWGLAIAFAVPALIAGPRLTSMSGLLTGYGAIWLVLLGRVALQCRARDGEIGCQAPGIEAWLMAGAALLAVGVALTVVAVGRRRRRAARVTE